MGKAETNNDNGVLTPLNSNKKGIYVGDGTKKIKPVFGLFMKDGACSVFFYSYFIPIFTVLCNP
jgi:hypothetical protein